MHTGGDPEALLHASVIRRPPGGAQLPSDCIAGAVVSI
jgi:hypothetical protein